MTPRQSRLLLLAALVAPLEAMDAGRHTRAQFGRLDARFFAQLAEGCLLGGLAWLQPATRPDPHVASAYVGAKQQDAILRVDEEPGRRLENNMSSAYAKRVHTSQVTLFPATDCRHYPSEMGRRRLRFRHSAMWDSRARSLAGRAVSIPMTPGMALR